MLQSGVALDSNARRRWIGVIVLGAALLMLVAGQSVLQGKMSGTVYILYWVVCLVLTCTAVVIAFSDVRATSRQIRKQEKELIQETIAKIEAESRSRKP